MVEGFFVIVVGIADFSGLVFALADAGEALPVICNLLGAPCLSSLLEAGEVLVSYPERLEAHPLPVVLPFLLAPSRLPSRLHCLRHRMQPHWRRRETPTVE